MVIMQRFVQVVQKVLLVWCMSEDLWWKGNDRKAKLRGHRRVSDEQTHQHTVLSSKNDTVDQLNQLILDSYV